MSNRGTRRLVRFSLALIASLVIAAVGLTLARYDLLFVDTVDKYLGDWRVALLSPRAEAQRTDIAVVIISEDTMLDYEVRSPISGTLIAELIRAIDAAEPKVIGLDFILDRRTRHTDTLLQAIREANHPIVLGAIDERISRAPKESLEIQEAILKAAERPAGHVLLGHKAARLVVGDATVRLIAADLDGPNKRESFSAVIAKSAGALANTPPSTVISWLLPPTDNRQPLFPVLELPRHKPDDVTTALQGIVPDHWRKVLKGRVVLVGAQMVDRDLHPTPLSIVDDSRMPGVLIHAQAVAQRLDASAGRVRDIRDLPYWGDFVIVAMVALACFFAGRRLRLGNYEKLSQVVALMVIGCTSLMVFWLWRINMPSGAITFAWLSAAFAGHYSEAVYRRLGA